MPSNPLNVVMVWHMHQPYYKDPVKNEYALPWTYLHGIKDYYDMPAIVDATPGAKAVFNLVPSLIEQLLEYASGTAVDQFLIKGKASPAELTHSDRIFLLENFFSANRQNMIEPYRRYLELLYMAGEGKPGSAAERVRHFSDQDLLDLQVWFFLSWTGEAASRRYPFFAELIAKGGGFTAADKEQLFILQQQLLGGIIPLYRRLHEEGRIELSVTPYFHPIMPLLCDFRNALVAMPRASLPRASFMHPEDARAQIKRGMTYFREIFGFTPAGMWPSEGSVSNEVVEIMAECGVKWYATDEEILARSLEGGLGASRERLYRAWHSSTRHGDIGAFFRDHQLSDLIGFTYAQWEPERGADDLCGRLNSLKASLGGGSGRVVPIILDGENAWEYYRDNAYDFLQQIYTRIAASGTLRLATCSEVLAKRGFDGRLNGIFPGSWINGNYAIWVGHPEENLAWELVAAAREKGIACSPAVAEALQSGEPASDPTAEAVCRSLYAAEGSDWFWWYGDDHFSPHSDRFDLLFRQHLMNVYRLLQQDPPRELLEPIKRKSPAGLIREPAAFIYPDINGRRGDYFEWLAAGLYDLTRQGAAMHSSDRMLQSFYYGYNEEFFFVRIDAVQELSHLLKQQDLLVLHLIHDSEFRLPLHLNHDATLQIKKNGIWQSVPGGGSRYRIARTCEAAISLRSLGISQSCKLFVYVTLLRSGEEAGRWPSDAPLMLKYAGGEIELDNWLI